MVSLYVCVCLFVCYFRDDPGSISIHLLTVALTVPFSPNEELLEMFKPVFSFSEKSAWTHMLLLILTPLQLVA